MRSRARHTSDVSIIANGDTPQEAGERVVRVGIQIGVCVQSTEDQRSAMAHDGITHFLHAADGIEAEGLIDSSLREGIGGGGGAGEPGSGYYFVEAREGEEGGCCGGEFGMHEDV